MCVYAYFTKAGDGSETKRAKRDNAGPACFASEEFTSLSSHPTTIHSSGIT